uniref:DALR anticodon binding domain-containing protein n=2 Tax=Photinus pyralis TaxID=7054 RepID=A0A1Y1KHR4_PHOPY
MDIHEGFLLNLYNYLLGVEDINNNIIKKHIRKLDQLGEFSVNASVLARLNHCTDSDVSHIFESITTASRNWILPIAKCATIRDTYHLYVDRPFTYKLVVSCVIKNGRGYGTCNLSLKQPLSVCTDLINENVSTMSLSELRAILIKSVIDRLLSFSHSSASNSNTVDINITCKAKKGTPKGIVCAPVLSRESNELKAVDLYNKRTIDMRLMAEHKYGLRVTSNSGWRDIFRKLGEAAVTIEILQIKPNRPVICNFNDFSSSCSKGASFILYNCARLATLLKEFQRKVELKSYPELPDLDKIDFSVLTQPVMILLFLRGLLNTN